MFTSWKLGRVRGIDVYLHPTLLFVAAYLVAIGGGPTLLALAVAAFGCVYLHEMGHALMAARYGIRTAHITLYPIGGVAALERMPRSPGPELLIALAGPAVNFAIAAGLWGLMVLGSLVFGEVPNRWLVQLLSINLGLGLFNLLPVFPMDGGRVLRALLSGRLGRARATVVAAWIGQSLAIFGGTMFLVQGMWTQVILAAFIYLAAGAERARVLFEEGRRANPTPRTDWPEPPIKFAWGEGRRVEPIRVRVVEPGGRRPWL